MGQAMRGLTIRLILSGLMTFLLCWHVFSAMAASDDEKGILWEISGNHLNEPSYLFGTIHTARPEVLELPAKVQEIFSQAKTFSAEVKIDAAMAVSVSQFMLLPKGQSLKSIMGQAVYQKTATIAATRGIPEMMLNKMRPWAVAVAISLPKQESPLVLDMKLYMEAQQSGKPVYGLESIEEQLSAFVNMSLDDQITMLNETLAQHHLFDAMFKDLLAAYLQRDLAELQRLDAKYQELSDSDVEDYLRKELLDKRNYRMRDRMQVRLKEGNAFIAIGALHLPGEQGLINLLRQQGYTVKPIY